MKGKKRTLSPKEEKWLKRKGVPAKKENNVVEIGKYDPTEGAIERLIHYPRRDVYFVKLPGGFGAEGVMSCEEARQWAEERNLGLPLGRS